MTRIIFADCEVTHLDPQVGHIWELALIVRDPGEADREHLWHIRPDLKNADPNALRIGGYYERLCVQVRTMGGAMPFANGREPERETPLDTELAAGIVAGLLDGAVLVGQNAQFDAAHLTQFLRRNGQAYTAHYRPVCVTTMLAGLLAARGEYPAPPWKSADVARAVGVDPGDYDTHTALGDARLARAIYDAVTGGAS